LQPQLQPFGSYTKNRARTSIRALKHLSEKGQDFR